MTISEFCYHPAVTEAETNAGYTAADFEFIEIYNPTAGPVDFTGCRFDDGIEFDFNLATQKVLPAGERMVLVANAAAFATRFPTVVPAGTFAGTKKLSNNGERIEFLSAAGPAIVDFTYSDAKPWPSAADGQGYSLVLRNAQMLPDPSQPGNWRLSLQPAGGTPSGVDSDSFAAWAQRTGSSAILLADSDGNGHTALEEYALAIPPGGGFGETLRITPVLLDGDQWEFELEFALNLAADDVRVLVQSSADLTNWAPATGLVPCPEGTPNASGVQSLKWLTGPLAPGTQFFRLLLQK